MLAAVVAAAGIAWAQELPQVARDRRPVARPAASPPDGPAPFVLLRRSSKKPPSGSLDVLVAADPARDAAARAVAALFAAPDGYPQFVLQLDRRVKRYLSRGASGGAAAVGRSRLTPPGRLDHPAFLFLSDREGGFPVSGFWLERPDGTLVEMRDVPFVDMVVASRDLNPGSIDGLEAIYAHELGHLVMDALSGSPPKRASSTMHFITVRTDGWQAFVEGFGEHFQPMAMDHAAGLVRHRDASAAGGIAGPFDPPAPRRPPAPASDLERRWHARFARERIEGCFICPASLRLLTWHGRGEQRLRDGPVRDNLFVHRVSLPPPLETDSRPAFEAQMYRDVIPPSPGGPLKNAAQMLESEGVVSTLFYRLATDARLMGTYRATSFYEPFLTDAEVEIVREHGPAAVITPGTNVYLKLFDVMHHRFEWKTWPTIDLVAAYAAAFPDEAGAVYDVFLDVTRGVTVDRAAATRHADAGYLAALRSGLLTGEVRLDANLGPPLWMVGSSFSLGMGVYRYFLLPSSYTFDLNAADVADLRRVPGVSASLAHAIVAAREARGWFTNASDLAAVPGMTPELVSRFVAMAAQMERRLQQPRPRGGNPGWWMNYLVVVLRGSFHAAAVWQYGSALLLAAFAYAIAMRLTGLLPAASRQPASAAPPAGGTVVPTRRLRRLLRRVAGELAPGVAVALLPCGASIALYAAGWWPTWITMAGVGLAAGVVVVLVRAAIGRGALRDGVATARVLASTVAASAVIGWLY